VTGDAWANFIASLDSATLEAERMRVHGDLDAERPGSRQDHETRFAHDYVRRDFWERMRGAAELRSARRQLEDADREIHARGFDRVVPAEDDNEIEAAIARYAATHSNAAAAAQPRGHAA
jgi:hypothetical protein